MAPAECADLWCVVVRIQNHYGWDCLTDLTPTDRCEDDAAASDTQFVGVWRQIGSDVIIRLGYSHGRAADGWVLLDLETHFVGETQYFTGIWEQSPDVSGFAEGDWCQLMEGHYNLSAQGYQLIDLERY